MADIGDASAEQELHNLKVALSHKKQALPYTGKCHWCKDAVLDKAQFCDADCRDDFTQYRRRTNGVL